MSKGGTAEKLFSSIDNCMSSFGISWSNCVAVGVDNTSVNAGKKNSLMARVQQRNRSTYFNGCPCHIVHNTSAAAASAFSCTTGFEVEDMMVDLYYWFDYSTKRKNKLAEYANFCDQEYRQIVKAREHAMAELGKACHKDPDTICFPEVPFPI